METKTREVGMAKTERERKERERGEEMGGRGSKKEIEEEKPEKKEGDRCKSSGKRMGNLR